MANNINRVSSSEQDIYNKLLDLAVAGSYITDEERYNTDDLLTTSTFGYITEAMAMIMRDSSFHKTMVYREGTLNTAILPKTIYNNAKMFNVTTLDAMPSLRYATITIDTNTILNIIEGTKSNIAAYKDKYGINENGNFMVLDKENTIIAGEYTFSLEHSIEIYRTTKQKFVVKYCLNEKNKSTSFGTYSNGGIINTSLSVIDGTTFLSFKVIIAQYKQVVSEKIISGSAFTDTKIHDFEYSGQICGLQLKYTRGSTEVPVDLKYSNIKLDDDVESEDMVAYYDILTDKKLEITFISNKNVPQTGGIIELITYITEGLGGNISFSGDAVFSIKQDDFKARPISISISQEILSSGRDQSSLGALKTSIINKLSLRDTIVTEDDLNIWFSTQSALLENTNNSKITFRKEKDNLLKRTFSAFLLLRDGVKLENYLKSIDQVEMSSSDYISSVVPTNTIDLIYTPINNGSGTENVINITPKILFTYDKNTKQFKNDESGINNDYCYRCPFEITINTKYNKASYYYMETDDTSELEFTTVDSMDGISIVPVSVSALCQNDIGNADSQTRNIYFKFKVASDDDLSAKILQELRFTNGYKDVAINENIRFEADTESESNSESKLSYYILTLTGKTRGEIKSTSTKISTISVYFGNNTEETEIVLNSDTKVGISFSLPNNQFAGRMLSTDNITLYYKLDDVLSSDVIESVVVNSATQVTSKIYTIKDVPVIASYWYTQSLQNRKWLIKQLFTYIDMLKSNINRLETSTFFNIKFRNTYGISKLLSTGTPQIRLNLTVYLNKDAAANVASISTLSDDDNYDSLKNEIRDFIRVRVDSANEEGKLQVSKIIMDTQAMYYNYINHIDFNSLNGTFNQSIETLDISNDDNSPLEYFSLDETLVSNSGKPISRISEDINFVLE